MSGLINQLKSDHQQISLLLAEVNKLGISTHEGQLKLAQVKNLLLKHLEKEDAELYPILNQEAKNNRTLKNNLQVLSVEMTGITDEALKFFKKYEGSGSGLEFGRDYGKLFSLLIQRITKEERVLYAEYDRIKAQLKNV